MKKRSVITTIFLMCLLFVGVFGISFWSFARFFPHIAQAPSPEEPLLKAASLQLDSFAAAKQEIYYRKCRHLVSTNLDLNLAYPGKSREDLVAMGWQIDDRNTDMLILSRDEEGFCPKDAAVRRLVLLEDGIGVYQGPKAGGGPLLQHFHVDTSPLPEEIRQQLSGEGMEFANEGELTAALDSMEELLGNLPLE